jgi:Acyl-CoA dehydrogenase, C-terminal domain
MSGCRISSPHELVKRTVETSFECRVREFVAENRARPTRAGGAFREQAILYPLEELDCRDRRNLVHADDLAPIEVTDRARVRLACTNAIQGAAEVADFAYKGAGVDTIFPGSPFERRFRDMHMLSQQIQARSAHFESVGQILLGVPPAVFL